MNNYIFEVMGYLSPIVALLAISSILSLIKIYRKHYVITIASIEFHFVGCNEAGYYAKAYIRIKHSTGYYTFERTISDGEFVYITGTLLLDQDCLGRKFEKEVLFSTKNVEIIFSATFNSHKIKNWLTLFFSLSYLTLIFYLLG